MPKRKINAQKLVHLEKLSYLCIRKRNKKQLNPKTRKGREIMKTYKNINEISDAEVLAILDSCMSNIFDEEKQAKKAARKAARKAQLEADFQECIRFCERAKAI